MLTASLSQAPPTPAPPRRFAAPPSGPRPTQWIWAVVLAFGILAALLTAISVERLGGGLGNGPFRLVSEPRWVADAIPGQRVVLLASLTDDPGGTGAADVTATTDPDLAADLDITIAPSRIRSGEVAEITVVARPELLPTDSPDGEPMLGQSPLRPSDRTEPPQPIDQPTVMPEPIGPNPVTVPITVTVTRTGARESVEIPIQVSGGEDLLFEAAAPLRDRFVRWLETAHPELGITTDTAWTPTIVQPHILVVSHYLFYSDEWEMGLTWHIMIAPYDWARIYLRPRTEMTPTQAFEISSVSDATASPHAMSLPDTVDR